MQNSVQTPPTRDLAEDAGSKSRTLPFIHKRKVFPIGRTRSNEVIEANSPSVDENSDAHPKDGQPPIKFISFVVLVAIPFFMCLYYFAFLASDQYIAEARFAVRSLAEQRSSDSVDSSVLSMDAASQDAYVVTSFIHSPELLQRIGKTIDYRAMFTGGDIDFFSKFDSLASSEEFQKFWQKQVSAYIDGPSGIITLRVRTFRPEDSKLLAEAILAQSEQLINELNYRAQQDMIASVRGEVERTGKAYSEALVNLNQFQLKSGLLSPQMQANESGKLLTGLLGQKLELETRLFVLKQSAAEGSPAYEQLVRAQESLDSQIEKMRAELTGPENASIAQAILQFSKLETDRLVAEKLYETSRSNYDSALAASLRKALYVMVFVHPVVPEEALYPRRISTPLIFALGLCVFWATLMLLWASIEDHKL